MRQVLHGTQLAAGLTPVNVAAVILVGMENQLCGDDGCVLWTEQVGQGNTLVLCHGGPGLWDYLDDVAGMLEGLGTVIRWDQRGCGRSQRRGPYSVGQSIADLDAVRRHAGQQRVTVFGHSWGALLALRYALRYPDRLLRLIYVSGTGIDPWSTWRPEFRANLRRQMGARWQRWEALNDRDRTAEQEREWAILQWSADFVDPRIGLRYAERMATPWLGINHECNATIGAEVKQYLIDNDVGSLCRELEVPTLIVDGAEDIRPRSAVDSLAQALPNAQRVIIRSAGHMPWVEQPKEFREAVTRFLN